MTHINSALISLLLILPADFASASVITLYDETQANLPNEQQWLSYFATGTATVKSTPNGVNLLTEQSTQAGFSNYSPSSFALKNPAFPLLNSTTGFTLSFSMQLNSEQHDNDNRAGFSVILLDNNKRGVEIGFWEDNLWSQSDSPLFQNKDEQVAFNSSEKMTSYDLVLFNNNYFLYADNQALLTGSQKDYTAFNGGPFGSSIPYSLENYLFLGDDTSSASANVSIGNISISDSPLFVVPIPPTIGLMCLSLVGLFRYQRLQKQ